MKKEIKKSYSKPQLRVHGDVETLTLVAGSVQPTDVPMGQPGQAFPLS